MCIGEEPKADGSISPADEGKKSECAELRKNRNTWQKIYIYKIGTWNVRSMSSGKLNTIITEMRENKLDILLSEHRWAGYGHFSTSCGGQIIYSRRERSGQSGVTVFLSKATFKSLIGYKPVNDRIITDPSIRTNISINRRRARRILRNITKGNIQQKETRHPDHSRRLQC